MKFGTAVRSKDMENIAIHLLVSISAVRSEQVNEAVSLPYRCLIAQAEVQAFIERCMLSVGTRPSHARSLAEVLVEGDQRGHYSHGLNRMGQYNSTRMCYLCFATKILHCKKMAYQIKYY